MSQRKGGRWQSLKKGVGLLHPATGSKGPLTAARQHRSMRRSQDSPSAGATVLVNLQPRGGGDLCHLGGWAGRSFSSLLFPALEPLEGDRGTRHGGTVPQGSGTGAGSPCARARSSCGEDRAGAGQAWPRGRGGGGHSADCAALASCLPARPGRRDRKAGECGGDSVASPGQQRQAAKAGGNTALCPETRGQPQLVPSGLDS